MIIFGACFLVSPSTQVVARRRTWRRGPLGGEGTVALLRSRRRGSTTAEASPAGCCCPHWLLLGASGLAGYDYIGYEVGHLVQCGYYYSGQRQHPNDAAANSSSADATVESLGYGLHR